MNEGQQNCSEFSKSCAAFTCPSLPVNDIHAHALHQDGLIIIIIIIRWHLGSSKPTAITTHTRTHTHRHVHTHAHTHTPDYIIFPLASRGVTTDVSCRKCEARRPTQHVSCAAPSSRKLTRVKQDQTIDYSINKHMSGPYLYIWPRVFPANSFTPVTALIFTDSISRSLV